MPPRTERWLGRDGWRRAEFVPMRHVRRRRGRRWTVRAWVLAVLWLASACERPPKTQAEKGAGVFARSCASCHAVSPSAKTGLGFKVAPPDLTDPKLLDRLSDARLRTVIREGKGEMPPFGRMLAEDQVNALLVYLRSRARSTPAGP